MKVIRNRLLPVGRRYGAINLFGIIFAKYDLRLSDELLNHEAIHTRQMRELFYLPFYIIYVAEWLIRLVQKRGNIYNAYMAISFEREAYKHGDDLRYLALRRPYAQWRRTM